MEYKINHTLIFLLKINFVAIGFSGLNRCTDNNCASNPEIHSEYQSEEKWRNTCSIQT